MKTESLLTLGDLSREEILAILDLAIRLKTDPDEKKKKPLTDLVVGLLFEKPSTRTRVSFEVGVAHLGGTPLYMSSSELQLGRGEPISDTARVLSRYMEMLVARVFSHETLEGLATHGTIPVINGLSDRFHPCQVLADLQTIRECRGKLEGVRIAYVGDGNNVCHSLLLGCAKVGMEIRAACPEEFTPAEDVLKQASKEGKVLVTHSPEWAVDGADIVYTDVWTSMGQEKETDRRLKAFQGYIVDAKLMAKAKPDAKVMHCLPAHRGEEISDEVIEGPASVVWDQAENRLHAQKAAMTRISGVR